MYCTGTYNEALRKLKRLEKEETVFTSTESDPAREVDKFQQAIKRQRLQASMIDMKAQYVEQRDEETAPGTLDPLALPNLSTDIADAVIESTGKINILIFIILT